MSLFFYFRSQDTPNMMATQTESILRGVELAKDIFCIGQKVRVGADYSEPQGTIVGLSDDIPYRAQVRLDHWQGSTTCWIKMEHLSPL